MLATILPETAFVARGRYLHKWMYLASSAFAEKRFLLLCPNSMAAVETVERWGSRCRTLVARGARIDNLFSANLGAEVGTNPFAVWKVRNKRTQCSFIFVNSTLKGNH